MKFKYALALVMAANFFIVSCDKDDINEGITSTEQTIIKLPALVIVTELSGFTVKII